MFGLLRLIVLCAVAFVAGILYERYNIKQACGALDGIVSNGLCLVKDPLQ